MFRSKSLLPSLFITAALFTVTGCESMRSLKYENQALQQRIFQYKQDYTALENEYQSLQSQYSNLNLQKEKLDSEISVLRQQVDSLNNLMTSGQKQQATQLLNDVQQRVEKENELKLQLERAEASLESTTNEKLIAESRIAELEEQIQTLESEKSELSANLTLLGENSEVLIKERDDSRSERDDFRRQIKALESSETEASSQIAELSEQLHDKEKEMTTLNQNLEVANNQVQDAQGKSAKIQEQKDAVHEKVKSDLSSFIQSGLVSVVMNDDVKIRISTDDLYQPGTVLLSTQGQDIVDAVGKTLSGLQNVSIILIEGHTDSVPVKNMPFIDNWDLAAARAATVTRTLSARPDVPSKKLRATSHAFFSPVGSNETTEGRKSNRRVEITLVVE